METTEKNGVKSSEKSSETGIYYRKTADKYRIAKFLTLVLLLFFIFLMILFGHDGMGVVHFRYLIKYMDINPMTLDDRYTDIAYAAGGGSKFALYKNDLAVIGEGKIAYYDLTGDLIFRDDVVNGNVSVDSSGKYLAVFVPGMKSLSIFHSFSKAFETEFSSPISQVSVSDVGVFAVCLKDSKRTSVLIYNDDFENERTLQIEDGIVMDMAISDDGKMLSIITLSVTDGSYFTKLEVWNLKKGDRVHSEIFSGKKPIATEFFSDGRFCIIMDRLLLFYNENGDQTKNIVFSSDSFQYDVDGNELLFLTAQRDWSLYSSKGKVLSDATSSESILDLKIRHDMIYLLLEKSVVLYDKGGECLSRIDISGGVLDFFVLDDTSVLLCYASGTKRIVPPH